MATKKAVKKKSAKPGSSKVAKKALITPRRPIKIAPTRAPTRVPSLTPSLAPSLVHEISQLLFQQAEALDGKSWQAFIDLFADDGVYWAPTDPSHSHWDGMPSIFTEDRDLMTVRMKRIQHPNAWSQQAEWGTSHVVSNITIERIDENGDVHARARFHMMELRRDDVRHFAGSYRHHFAKTKAGYRIKLQRVDMINAQAPFEYVLQAWV